MAARASSQMNASIIFGAAIAAPAGCRPLVRCDALRASSVRQQMCLYQPKKHSTAKMRPNKNRHNPHAIDAHLD